MLKGITSLYCSVWSVINPTHYTQKPITPNSGKWNRAIHCVLLLSEGPGAHWRQTGRRTHTILREKRVHWRKTVISSPVEGLVFKEKKKKTLLEKYLTFKNIMYRSQTFYLLEAISAYKKEISLHVHKILNLRTEIKNKKHHLKLKFCWVLQAGCFIGRWLVFPM